MVIFVAGIYGVGKSTLCSFLSKELNIPNFSAGDLISEVNGEKYGSNKVVKDKNGNQDILVSAINEKYKTTNTFLLAGHFCIFNAENEVDMLPDFVFGNMNIGAILLLEADVKTIIEHLSKRDGKHYSDLSIEKLQISEREQAEKISSQIGVPLLCHKMLFDGTDESIIKQWIERYI